MHHSYLYRRDLGQKEEAGKGDIVNQVKVEINNQRKRKIKRRKRIRF
jgi:hypothetical protein